MESVFASDLEFNNQCYGILVRSEHIGNIVDIQLPELDDNCSFITHKDIRGKNAISLFGNELPIFANERIDYAGQAVGIVIGQNKQIVKNIVDKIVVIVEEKEEAEIPITIENIENIKEKYRDRVIAVREKKTEGIDECFKDETKITTSFLYFSPRSHYHAEPLSVSVRTKQNSIDVYVPTQWANHVQMSVAEAIKESKEKIKVISTTESYSLNGRIWYPSLIATQVAVAAYVLKKNISLVSSFKESFLYSTFSPRVAIRHKTEIDSDGKIKAMSIMFIIDEGKFNPLIEQMVLHIFVTSFGVYNVPLYDVCVLAIRSSNRLTDIFINWGDYYTNTAIEKHVSDIVDKFSLNPIQFRIDNMLKVNDESITGVRKKDDYKIALLMEKASKATTFLRKYAAYRAFNFHISPSYESYCRGVGIAVGMQYNGIKSVIKEGANYTVELTLTKEQELFVKAEPSSNELKELFKKKIEKALNIDASKIFFESIKNIPIEYIGPSMSSCTISVLPILLDRCIAEMQKQRFREPLPIVVKKDYKITGRSGWDSENMEGQPFISETSGVCVLELTLEKNTYNVKVENVYIVVEGVDAFPKRYIISSINRAITHSISGVLRERMPTTYRRASDYTIISPNEMPKIQVEVLNASSSQGKGVANLPCNLVAAAFMSALNQILQTEHLNILPITQEDIFNIMKDINSSKTHVNYNTKEDGSAVLDSGIMQLETTGERGK